MQFNGFRSIAEYERECVRLGYTTERVPFHNDSGKYFALVTYPPKRNDTSVGTWHLFADDESKEVLTGVISSERMQETGVCVDGVDINWIGTLAAHGYFPDEPGEEKRLRTWLLSPGYQNWLSQPGKRKWIATWCVPVSTICLR